MEKDCEMRGYLNDFMSLMGNIANFTWTSHSPTDGSWGSMDENGVWTTGPMGPVKHIGQKVLSFHKYKYVCTRVQSSEMAKILDIFEDPKIDKMDIIFCHDPQIVICKKLLLLFTWIDFKYKKVHIHKV